MKIEVTINIPDDFIKNLFNVRAETPVSPVPADTTEVLAKEINPLQVNNSEFDSAGRKWDSRIDNDKRAVNKDGTWKRRRNTPDEVYNAVIAELTAQEAGTNAKYILNADLLKEITKKIMANELEHSVVVEKLKEFDKTKVTELNPEQTQELAKHLGIS